MEFFNAYSRPATEPTASGEATVIKYMESFNDLGEVVLLPTETINTYELRQADKDLVDINKILKRYAAGDVTAIGDPNSGSYIDTSELPDDLFAIMRTMKRVETAFDQLNADQRAVYGNDFRQFLASALEMRAVEPTPDAPSVEPKPEEVKE